MIGTQQVESSKLQIVGPLFPSTAISIWYVFGLRLHLASSSLPSDFHHFACEFCQTEINISINSGSYLKLYCRL